MAKEKRGRRGFIQSAGLMAGGVLGAGLLQTPAAAQSVPATSASKGARLRSMMAEGDIIIAPIVPDIKPGATLAQIMRAFAKATIAAVPDRRVVAVGRLTGLAYALGHDDLRARVEHVTADSYEIGAAWLRSVAERDELPMPPEVLVCVIHALTEGLLFQRFLTPALVPDKVFYAAFGALATVTTKK